MSLAKTMQGAVLHLLRSGSYQELVKARERKSKGTILVETGENYAETKSVNFFGIEVTLVRQGSNE